MIMNKFELMCEEILDEAKIKNPTISSDAKLFELEDNDGKKIVVNASDASAAMDIQTKATGGSTRLKYKGKDKPISLKDIKKEYK